MKKLLGILGLVLALGGCAAPRDYAAELNPWIGQSEHQLVDGWGIPDKQYNLDSSTKIISYVSYQNVMMSDMSTSCIGASPLYHCNNFPSTVRTYSCETLFTLVRGRVTRWGHRGNSC